MKHAGKISLLLYLSTFLIFGSQIFKDTVICFGSDGHIAVEIVSDLSYCGDITRIVNLSPSLEKIENEYCEPCFDIPIHVEPQNQYQTTKYKIPSHTTTHHLPASFKDKFTFHLLSFAPELSPALNMIQTTVLLI